MDLGDAVGDFGTLNVGAGGAELLMTSVSGGEPPAVIQLRRYSWSGDLLGDVALRAQHGVTSTGPVLVSPDGTSVAWQEQLPLAIPLGAGGQENWPAVVIADAETGETRFRVVRASLTNGTRTLAWLADGSAIVVATAQGFALLSAADGSLAPLPLGPAAHFQPVPIPAPDDPALFLFDGRVVDRPGNPTRASTPAAEAWGPAWWNGSTYGWRASDGELRFARWAPLGRDFGRGGLSHFGVPARVEHPPFPDSVRLRVAGTGALDVRHGPDSQSEVIATVAGGAVVIVADAGLDSGIRRCDADDECPARSYRGRTGEEHWWLHVRTEGGEQGWALSEFLAWAE